MTVHRLVAVLTGVYLLAAIAPWLVILFPARLCALFSARRGAIGLPRPSREPGRPDGRRISRWPPPRDPAHARGPTSSTATPATSRATKSRASSRTTRATPIATSRAGSTGPRSRHLPSWRRVPALLARGVPGLHAEAVAGAPAALRREPAAGAARPRPAVHRASASCGPAPGLIERPAAGADVAPGTSPLIVSFVLLNLLVLLEVADRLSLKNDLEIARDIQHAMLRHDTYRAPGRRDLRPDQARQHGRRRLLRDLPAAGRARDRRARRRGRARAARPPC